MSFLCELGIPSTFVPIGYTPTLGRSLAHGGRDIDVLFFGHVSSRRRWLLNKIDAALRQAGYKLKVIERDCYGDDRTAILNRSKIVLNLHKFPWEFAGQRLLMAMSLPVLCRLGMGARHNSIQACRAHVLTARDEELPEILVTLLRDQNRDQGTKSFETILDFSDTLGILRAAEQCNGSGDCRKTELSGGTMCPSYMATRNEQDTTRARANILREMLRGSQKANPFAHEEIKEVMDLCLSCKGCKSECPSNVDMGKLKQEWQYQYYKEKGVPFRSRVIGNFGLGMKLASLAPWGYRAVFGNRITAGLAKSIIGFARDRSMPKLSKISWQKWYKTKFKPTVKSPIKTVYLFVDELLNFNEAEIGIATVTLLDKLGYGN